MTMKTPWLFLLAAVFPFGVAAEVFEADLAKDGVEKLIEPSAKAPPEVSGGLLALPTRIETRPLPVEPGKKYHLEIDAEVGGDFVVEANDRAPILTLQTHRNSLTGTYEVIFLDADGQEIPALGGANAAVRGFFLTRERKPYIAVFYAPEKAASLKVRFQSNGRPARIARLRLAEETGENTVNPNPDFRYGELNYCGWQPQREGRLYTRPDGKTVFNAGYGGTSPFFPLHPGVKYQVSATGEGKTINIQYFNQEGKSILSRFLIRPAPNGAETELTPPPGTVMARVTMFGGVILEEFKVVKVE